MLLLGATVGVPYFTLATTSPLLQAWHARSGRGEPPYRLFALSNLGSLAALLTYPFAVEPFLSVRAQEWIWSALYACFVLGTTDGDVTEVQGLEPGAVLAADNFNRLTEGAKVTVRPAAGERRQGAVTNRQSMIR